MFLRMLVGLLIGAACGAVIGAASFGVSESIFGRGIGILTKSPLLAAIIGIVFVGAPSAVVGAIVGGFNLGYMHSMAVAVAVGLCMVTLFLLRSERKYFYEGGYFDKQFFFYDLVINATWLFGLVLVAIVVSALMCRLFAPDNIVRQSFLRTKNKSVLLKVILMN